MAGLVLRVDQLVLLDELLSGPSVGVMDAEAVRLRVAVDVGRARAVASFGSLTIDTQPFGPIDVLHEECDLAHHRSPAGLVPADRAVVERHLQLAVVVHVGLDLVARAARRWRDTRTGRAPVIWHMTST